MIRAGTDVGERRRSTRSTTDAIQPDRHIVAVAHAVADGVPRRLAGLAP